MNTFARYGLAAAAAVVVAFLAWTLLFGSGPRIAAPGPSSSPTQSPTPVASPSGTPVPVVHESTSSLEAKFSIPFSYDVPTNWTRTGVSTASVDLHDETQFSDPYGIAAYSLIHMYKDPCRWKSGMLNAQAESNRTPDQVAAEMKKWPGFAMSAPTPITIGGYSGVSVDFHSNVVDLTFCDTSAKVRLMEADPSNFDEFYGSQIQSRWILLEVKGHTVLLEAWSFSTPLAQRLPAIQRVLDSIAFS